MKNTAVIAAFLGITTISYAQGSYPKEYSDPRTQDMTPEMSEFYAPQPRKVSPAYNLVAGAPSDAEVLFDGTDLDKWCGHDGRAAGWTINGDGSMTVDKSFGDIRTKDSYRTHIQGGRFVSDTSLRYCAFQWRSGPEPSDGARHNRVYRLAGIYGSW